MDEKTLAHYGVLGMKWGVRRYQNSDGTLTSAGKKRYAAETVKKAAKAASKVPVVSKDGYQPSTGKQKWLEEHTGINPNLERKPPKGAIQNLVSTQKPKMPAGTMVDGYDPQLKEVEDKIRGRIPNVHPDYEKAHSNKDVTEMSDKELRERLNRLDMEQRYDKLNPDSIQKGKSEVNKILKGIGTVAATTSAIITIVNNVGKIGTILKGGG